MMGRVKGLTGIFFVLKYFEYFVVYFMAVNQLKEKKQIERFLFTILVVCFIVCLVAIYQIPSGVRVSAPFEGAGRRAEYPGRLSGIHHVDCFRIASELWNKKAKGILMGPAVFYSHRPGRDALQKLLGFLGTHGVDPYLF